MKRWIYVGMVLAALLMAVIAVADVAQDIKEHRAEPKHSGSMGKEELAWGVGIMTMFGSGLVGVIYASIAKRLDDHGKKIDKLSESIAAITPQVSENTRSRVSASTELSRDMSALRESVQALTELTRRRNEV